MEQYKKTTKIDSLKVNLLLKKEKMNNNIFITRKAIMPAPIIHA